MKLVLWHQLALRTALVKILESHPPIHTAEREFFRNAVRKACEGLKISATAQRSRPRGLTPPANFALLSPICHRIFP